MSRDCVGPRSRVGPLPLCETCLHGPCAGQCHRKDVQEKTGETYLPVAHGLTSCFPLVKACPQRVKLTHPGRTFRPLPQPLVQARKWWEKPESQGARRAGLALQRQPRRKSPDECSWSAPGVELWGSTQIWCHLRQSLSWGLRELMSPREPFNSLDSKSYSTG